MKVVTKTNIDAFPLLSRGKVRDIYDIDIRIEEIDGNRIGVYFA